MTVLTLTPTPTLFYSFFVIFKSSQEPGCLSVSHPALPGTDWPH